MKYRITNGFSLGRSFLAGMFILAGALSVSGQQFKIDWFTLDGGGGQSSGGTFTIAGTIGQPDAGKSSGGTFTLQGGFWSAVGVQTTGVPGLRIAKAEAPGFVVISWTPASSGYVLQTSTTLDPQGWTDAPSGSANPAFVSATAPWAFFRLRPQ